MGKDIIFFSNYCEYSKEILGKLQEANLLEAMVKVCVDDRNIKLPQFITAVPTIYLMDKKAIVKDEQIMEWVVSMSPKKNTVFNELGSYMNGGAGDNFAFLDDSDNPDATTLTYIDQDMTITTPNEANLKKRSIEQLEKERSIDMNINTDNMPKQI